MTDATDDRAEIAPARSLLALSERTLADLLCAFERMTERALADQLPQDTEVTKAVLILSKCRTTLIEEMQNYERRVLSSTGLTTDAGVDLDAARRDIGRRLDRLRATR